MVRLLGGLAAIVLCTVLRAAAWSLSSSSSTSDDPAFEYCLPVLSTTADTTVAGTYLEVTSWHARNVTKISWNNVAGVTAEDYIAVFEDKYATHYWLGAWNPWLALPRMKPKNHTKDFTTVNDTAWCQLNEYVYDRNGSFYSPTVRAQGVVVSPTWFYTNTLDQQGGSNVAATGSAKVHLAEVGLWQVCLMRNRGAGCTKVECVQIEMYQPPEDYVEADTVSIVDTVRIRYNLVSRNSYPTGKPGRCCRRCWCWHHA